MNAYRMGVIKIIYIPCFRYKVFSSNILQQRGATDEVYVETIIDNLIYQSLN